MRTVTSFVVGALLLVSCPAGAQSPLAACAEQFIGGSIENAPTIGRSAPDTPFATNKHLCYRADDASFFAVEYWPEQFAPRWAAYRLSPACASSEHSRQSGRLFIGERASSGL